MSIKEALISDPKIAAGVAAAATSSGVATTFEWLPANIGNLASMAGLILSVVLIITTSKKGIVEYKNLKLQQEKLKLEVQQMREASASKKNRRAED